LATFFAAATQDGLQHAARLDGGGEFGKAFGVEVHAGLPRGADDFADGEIK